MMCMSLVATIYDMARYNIFVATYYDLSNNTLT